MKKGIVMEIDETFLTLLTPEGEFLRAKKSDRHYAIGEETPFFPVEVPKKFAFFGVKRSALAKPVWIAAAALFICLGSFIPMYQDNKAYAYMSIDVNPSIELSVNKKMQVVELTGYNKEGKMVISHVENWKKQDVSAVTKKILAEMKHEGYLENNHKIIISTIRTKQPERDAEKKLNENMEDIKAAANNEQLDLTVLTGTEKDLKKAHELGITAGKYQATTSQKDHLNGSNMQTQPETSSQTVEEVPPGQLKKQAENTEMIGNECETNFPNDKKEGKNQSNEIPPGQLKKLEEEQKKVNPRRNMQQSNISEKSNQNNNSKNNNDYNYGHENNNRYDHKNDFKYDHKNDHKNK